MQLTMSGRLPVRCPPQPDELFSSWIHRLAWANGEKAQTLAFKAWGREPNIWMADVDRTVKDTTVEHIAAVSGESAERIRATTLATYCNWLVFRFPKQGPLKWILPLSVTKDRQFGRGVQYCAHCLASDERPYFRRQWRVAFSCYCTRHHVVLSEGCPACGGPVGLHLCDRRHRHARYEYPLLQCNLCGTRLTTAKPEAVTDRSLESFQQKLEEGLAAGWLLIGDRVVYSPLAFEGLRMLGVFLTRHRRSERLHAYFASMGINLDAPLFYSRRVGFEDLLLTARIQVLNAVAWLMESWPDRLIEACDEVGISSSYLLEVSRSVPFWFLEPVHQSLDRDWYAITDAEVDAAWAYLKRVRSAPQKRELARLLHVSYLNRRTYQRLK